MSDEIGRIATRLRRYISDGEKAPWVGGERARLIGDVSKLEAAARGPLPPVRLAEQERGIAEADRAIAEGDEA